MDLIPELQANLDELDKSISTIEERLEPFFSVPLSDLKSRLDPYEQAKLSVVMSYMLNSLFYSMDNT